MIDLAKRVGKHGADLLFPGEAVLGALQLIPPAGVSWGAAGGTTGNLLGAAVGAALDMRAEHKHEERSNEDREPPSQAAKFPSDGAAIVAVTDRRLVFFTITQGRAVPKEIFLEIPYAELAGLQRHDLKKRAALRFMLKDGRVFDASTLVVWPNRPNAEKFFEAFERMAGSSS